MSETPTRTALRPTASGRLQAWLPRLVLAPSVAVSLFFVYGFMLLTFVLSLTSSRMLPSYDFVGFGQYARLMANERWWVASTNLMIFGTLFIVICLVLGALLAMLLDQKIRQEGALRTVYLYPMALSFIVTGTAWKWFLDPGIGLENVLQPPSVGCLVSQVEPSLPPRGVAGQIAAVDAACEADVCAYEGPRKGGTRLQMGRTRMPRGGTRLPRGGCSSEVAVK